MKMTPTITFVLSTLLATATTTQAQSVRQTILPKTLPDLVLQVERKSGNCPKTIGIWTTFRYYEGGGENTIIADTWAIADRAQLISSGKKVVEYKAPLKTAYTTCIGRARNKTDQEDLYRFRFRDGNVYFRVELPPDTAANPAEFTARSILGARPYVRWAIAD